MCSGFAIFKIKYLGMNFKALILLLSVGVAAQATAQQASVKRYTTPRAGTVVLNDVEDKYNAHVYNLEVHAPDANIEKKRLAEIKRKVATEFPRHKLAAKPKTTSAPMPIIGINYLADSNVGIPPDNDLALSNAGQTISVVNSFIATHNATTGQMVNRKSLRVFSASVGLNSIQQDFRYDPKIIYDPQADKFICVMLNASNSSRNFIVVGFSATNDPLGAWNFYRFLGNHRGDSTWFDYPSIAITQKEFFITGNKIRDNVSWQQGFKETVIYQIDKQSGYKGDTSLNYQIWDDIIFNGGNIRNLYPVKGGDGIYGPEQYFLSNRNFDIQNDTVFLVKIPDTIGSTNTNLSITTLISNIPYGVPPNGRQTDTFVLATNDARVLGAFREGNEIQFTSTTVHPATGSSAVYHGKINNFATNPTLQASYFVVDTLDFGYPNLSFAGKYGGAANAIISFNYTGPSDHPGLGAIYYDGSQYSDLLKIKTGDSSITRLPDREQRWGDYMGSQPEWNAIGAVWIEGIYGRKNRDYGNWIARLVSPFWTASVPNVAASPSTASLYPNPAFVFIKAQFQLSSAAVVDFAIYDLQGRRLDQVLLQQCKKGNNEIRLNVASLVPGVYFLKGTTQDGKNVMSQRFVKQ